MRRVYRYLKFVAGVWVSREYRSDADVVQSQSDTLCVDLDGTLVRTDTLHEAILLYLRGNPFRLFRLIGWLWHGKAAFKHRVAEQVELQAHTLPYNKDVLRLIKNYRESGGRIVLATAANRRFAERVAEHLGVFDEVVASGDVNLYRQAKCDVLTARFGKKNFDYVGDHRDDLPTIAVARSAYLVGGSLTLKRAAGTANPDIRFVQVERSSLRILLKALRPHQWSKNGLIFVPLFASDQFANPILLLQAFVAFLSFSLAASAVYVFNDLTDLASDRVHLLKRRRPFASGALSITTGVVMFPLLLGIAATLAFYLHWAFALVLTTYVALTTAYSLRLKRQVAVDVLLLAGLYTIRIVAGSAATMIAPSFWLLAFSMFIFLSLALGKRYSELKEIGEGTAMIPGRGYQPSDLLIILALGTGSGLVSVLVFGLYTQSPFVAAHYARAEFLWLVPPILLYWVTRLWVKYGRNEIHDDPVIFATTDWQSIVSGGSIVLIFLLARSIWW